MDIRGKTVLITGASEGIGAACARAFAAAGARLALNARNEDRLRAASPEGSLVVAGDITDTAVQRRFVDESVARFGTVDILVNNAGAGLYRPSWKAPMEESRRLFDLNFFAPLSLIQLAAPHMRKQRSGFIVNIGSIAGKMTLPWFTLYSASKYALGSLSDGLRMELARDGVRVMNVCPGYVDTAFQSHIIGGKVPTTIARSRRFAITVEQCAAAIVRGVEQNQRTLVAPRVGWLLIAFARLFPRIMDVQLTKLNYDLEA